MREKRPEKKTPSSRLLKALVTRPLRQLKRKVLTLQFYDFIRAHKMKMATSIGLSGALKEEHISIILPDAHRTDQLREAILSVINQPYTNYELLIILDGPLMETREVALEFKDNPRVKIFEIEKNTGNAVLPRNVGIKEASCPLVTFLDSDDLLHPNKLGILANLIGDADLIYGNSLVNKNGKTYATETVKVDLKKLLEKDVIPINTVVVKREALLAIGGFKPRMRYMEDYELWARLLYHGYRFRYVKGSFGIYNIHSGNLEISFKDRRTEWKAMLLEEYRLVPEKMALPDYKALN